MKQYKEILYPEEMFTEIRMYLMMIGQCIFRVNEQFDSEEFQMPSDLLEIHRSSVMLDNQVMAAQRARGLSDTKLLDEVRDAALKLRKAPDSV